MKDSSDPRAIPDTVEPYPVVANIEFPEGPIFDREGNLYFVNYIRNGNLGRMTPAGEVSVWRRTQGLMLGLKCDREGRILATDYGLKRIVRFPPDIEEPEVLAEGYRGVPFNGPNDLCLDGTGSIFFSDPGDNFQDPVGQIFRLSLDGRLTRLDSGLLYPNGIAVSPDQRQLYVSETVTRKILVYDLSDKGVSEKRELIQFATDGVDGIMFDEFGRLWVARWKNGTVDCVSRDGTLLGSLPAGGHVTNLCWWKDSMYVTVSDRHSIHRLDVGFGSA